MKVTLLSTTPDAAALLVFTKSTRLTMAPGLFEEIKAWPFARLINELEYMAKTIPSSWEFVDYVFMIEGVSRAFTHQFVRSRHGSYAQQSMRVVGMSDFDYVMTDRNKDDLGAIMIITEHNEATKRAYAKLRDIGQDIEDARGILPTNIATNIVAKFNLRTLSEMAKARTGGRTQGEYIQVMNAMADAVIVAHPWAHLFLFPHTRSAFEEIEQFAEREFGGDLLKKGELLKIVDLMRRSAALS